MHGELYINGNRVAKNNRDGYLKLSNHNDEIRLFLKECSTFIDAVKNVHYNEIMETMDAGERVENLIGTDRAEPKKRVLMTDGALYVVLLVAVIGMIVAGNAVSALLELPRILVQIVLYAILLTIGYLVYRYRLLAFRYVLTERMLYVERVVGQKTRSEAQAHLSDIESIRPFSEETEGAGKRLGLYTGARKDALALCVRENGVRRTLLISPSAEFAGKLTEQWKKQRK